MQTVYIYVDGSDNKATETLLVSAFSQLADKWSGLGALVVNQQHERTPDLQPDDCPDWFIGLNIPLERFGHVQAAELVPFARDLARATGQEFVVGVASSLGITEDLIFLGPDAGEREHRDLLQHGYAIRSLGISSWQPPMRHRSHTKRTPHRSMSQMR